MPSAPLPRGIHIRIVSEQTFSGWSAFASVYDQANLNAPPLQPLPAVERVSKLEAKRVAFTQLRDWINAAWPRRTVPDPR